MLYEDYLKKEFDEDIEHGMKKFKKYQDANRNGIENYKHIPSKIIVKTLKNELLKICYSSDSFNDDKLKFKDLVIKYETIRTNIVANHIGNGIYSDHYSIMRHHPYLGRVIGAFAIRLYKKIKNNSIDGIDEIEYRLIDFILRVRNDTEMDFVTRVNNICKYRGYNTKIYYNSDIELKEFLEKEYIKLKDIGYELSSDNRIKYHNDLLIEKHYKKLRNSVDIKGCGVYFLYNDDLEIEYIGQSTVLGDRVLQSMKNNKLKNFSLMHCDSKEHAKAIEKYFIVKYKPKFNGEFKATTECGLNGYEVPSMSDMYKLNIQFINSTSEIVKIKLNEPIFYELPIVK